MDFISALLLEFENRQSCIIIHSLLRSINNAYKLMSDKLHICD